MTKLALITGASRGLGAALALELASTHHVVAVARTTGALEELDDRIKAAGGQATLAPMDVTVPEAMAQLCRSIYDRWGQLDLWAHAAIHAPPLTPAQMIGEKDWAKSVEININATQRLISYVAPLLGTSGQALFFEDERASGAFFGAYGATKAAQIALARSWADETQKTGPKVHIAKPKGMATATRARFFPSENRDNLATPAQEAKAVLSVLS
ncbi:MAG: SDR family NAD(P)-dependent oxidoreductase [Pseudomonadota bacterium]